MSTEKTGHLQAGIKPIGYRILLEDFEEPKLDPKKMKELYDWYTKALNKRG